MERFVLLIKLLFPCSSESTTGPSASGYRVRIRHRSRGTRGIIRHRLSRRSATERQLIVPPCIHVPIGTCYPCFGFKTMNGIVTKQSSPKLRTLIPTNSENVVRLPEATRCMSIATSRRTDNSEGMINCNLNRAY